jgi:PAS domain S-box-containing protein
MFRCIIFIVALLIVPALVFPDAGAEDTISSIRVVMDDNYPPYVFKENDGWLKGILIDQWRLWENKTGIRVQLNAMDWDEAQRLMQAGEFDVIDTLFHNEKRERIYDFTKPYARIDVPIFFRSDISGIHDQNDLKGFTVGVKAGDNAIEVLKAKGVTNLIEFKSYEAIIMAAREGKLNVFTVDKPPALYFLIKMGIQDRFNVTKPLYTGELHRAVRKGQQTLLEKVESGFAQISKAEYEEIEQRWYGAQIGMKPETLRFLKIAALFVVTLILSLSYITFFLKRRLNEKVAGLRVSELKYRELVENANSIILRMDAACRVTFFNEFAQRFFGFQEKEILGRHVVGTIVPPTDSSGRNMIPILDEIARNTSAYSNNENENICRNGERVWIAWTNKPVFDETGKLREILCIGNDITERKRNDEARTLLSMVIEQAEENVLITDDRRTIIYINPAFELSSGYSCKELKGQKLKTLRSDQHEENFYRATKEILDRGEIWMGVIFNKGKDGTNFEIEGTISPIKNASGSITHFVAVGRNMSRFRRLEKELQQAQKLDALGTLAGGIAHDFNNVLTAIMGLIEMESLDAGEGSQSRRRMAQALSACCRARDLIKQILAFSRQSDQQRKPIEMGPIVEDVFKMLRSTLPATIDMRLSLKAGQSIILGDPTQLHQVIVNLCTNAAHAMRDMGGILEIDLDNVEIDAIEAAEHLDQRPGSYVRLVVGDTGHGMDRKTLDRIFEPFFTTKGSGEGTGIGLAVVHGIVKSHGGRITADSKLGKGSTFQIYFPRMESAVAPADKLKSQLPTGNERILLVDDEEMLVDVITDMLTILGYEVVSANRSLDALQLFRSQCERFHLVITDLTMPEMTGMELAAELLRIRGDIPIILSTGFTCSEIREKAMTMGIRQIMKKPFILQELAKTVRQVLDGHISDVEPKCAPSIA